MPVAFIMEHGFFDSSTRVRETLREIRTRGVALVHSATLVGEIRGYTDGDVDLSDMTCIVRMEERPLPQ